MNNNTTARAMSAAGRLGMPNTQIRPHTLILAARLNPVESSYDIDLRDEVQKNILPGVTRGLVDRDGFMASAMALGIYTAPVIDGVEYPTNGQAAFFPDPNLFDAPAVAPGVLDEAEILESLFWGTHSLKTNEGIRIDKNPNFTFRHVQQTQTSAATTNMLDGSEFKDIGADVRFGGGDENFIIIRHTSKDKTLVGGPADRNNYILVMLQGAILKGSTTKAYVGR